MQARVNLCPRCAAELRAILAAKGVEAMARAIGRVLCATCRKGVPGYRPGQRLVTHLKARPS